MARRKRSGSSARRGPGGRRGRRPAGGGTLVHLTDARRRAAAGRRGQARPLSLVRRAAPGGAATTAGGPGERGGREADFHLASAIQCARAGGRVLLDYWGKRGSLNVREKGRNDFVTVVDREAEAAVVRIIRERFPDHAIVAEESAPRAGTVGYTWYIDPLDGTTNFIHGYPLFSVSVGVADAQGMRAAAVYDPIRSEMFTAARGRGAFLNGAPIRASGAETLARSLLVTGFPFRSLSRLDEYLGSFRSFIIGTAGLRRDGSAALNLAYVACGRYDGFWEMALSPWDIAAGSLLVTEAGGKVSDFSGGRDSMSSGDIVAATPAIHASMVRILKAR